MAFNSIEFLIFLAIVYSLYVVLAHRPQNLMLLVASYLFYGWWDWRFLSLIFFSTLFDYLVGLGIPRCKTHAARRALISASVCMNLGLLGFFKYFNFFAESLVEMLNRAGVHADPVTLHIVLPVGISFYTFQAMSYTIDVYRGELKPARDFFDFALYISFFPQLVAGPIERATHLVPQVQNPRVITYLSVREGAWLILRGFFKKVVIADNLAEIADTVFNHPADHHGLAVLLGVYAFAFQIYCDFSGYSDIARGCAKLMGFELMQNFRIPYLSGDPQEFWRRWHISLSTWLRDYLYIPLGGNKKGTLNTYRNLFLTMLLGGLWHGAAWNFVAWGAFQGLLLVVHRLVSGRHPPAPVSLLARLPKALMMFQFICLGWVFFRINEMADFPILMKNLFSAGPVPAEWLPAMLVLLAPLWILELVEEKYGDTAVVHRFPAPAKLAAYGVLMAYIVFSGKTDGQQFIYFQF
jgi:D-alanyl-lipoteichoic acid acyltransferase DltB (MBOAT superfamily)